MTDQQIVSVKYICERCDCALSPLSANVIGGWNGLFCPDCFVTIRSGKGDAKKAEMTDQQKLVEEAATLARETFGGPGYAGKVAWVAVATTMRDFWASHAEPAEMDTAKALKVASRHVTKKGISVTSAGPNGRTMTAAEVANYLETLRHYLDQAHRETAEAERIGRAVLEWQNSHIGLWSRSEFGAFILATVREGE